MIYICLECGNLVPSATDGDGQSCHPGKCCDKRMVDFRDAWALVTTQIDTLKSRVTELEEFNL